MLIVYTPLQTGKRQTARGAEGTVVTGMTRIRCVEEEEEEEVGKRSRVMVFAVAGVIQRGLTFLRERSAAAMTGLLHKNIVCDIYIYIHIHIHM
jgi:hypothetical protein